MEIIFNKDAITGMEFIGQIEDNFSAESESIIPDTMPDAEDIRDVSGTIIVKRSGVDSGRCVIEGNVIARVSYCPDGKGMLRTVCLKIPYINYTDAPNMPENSKMIASAKVGTINAGLINARKIAVSAKICVRFDIYAPSRIEYCQSVDNPPNDLQVDYSNVGLTVPYTWGEKTAELSEDMEIGTAKPPVGEIMRFDVKVTPREVRPITNKVLIKAAMEIKIVYMSSGSEGIYIVENEIPFSQVVEMDGADENCVCNTEFALTDLMAEPVENISGEMRYVAVDAKVRTDVLCYRRVDIFPIRDMYSTSDDAIKTSARAYSIKPYREEQKQQVAIRDLLEIKDNIGRIYDLRTEVGNLEANAANETVELGADIRVVVLFENTEGEIKTAAKSLRAGHSAAVPSNSIIYNPKITVYGESYTINGVSGIDIRMMADITFILLDKTEFSTIISAERIASEGDGKKQPSLVMCFSGKDEDLWEIAKRYKTTVGDILTANRIEDARRAPSGRMLIIPRKSL